MIEVDKVREKIASLRYAATQPDIRASDVQAYLLDAIKEIEEANNFFFDGHDTPIANGDTLLEKIKYLVSEYEEEIDNLDLLAIHGKDGI